MRWVGHADVSVVMVDRRHGAGGHWLDAYPFVRLHQASAFYGVASTLLGDGRIQQDGPEGGLHERASAPGVCAYYDRVLRRRLLASGKVSFHPSAEYLGEGRFVSRISGRRYEVRGRASRRGRALSLTGDTGDDTGAVRSRGRVGAAAIRPRRFGQDCDRRVHLAAGQRCRPRRHLLGAAA